MTAHLKAKGVLASAVFDLKTSAGNGVESTTSGLVLRAGKGRWLNLSGDSHVKFMLSQGYTAVCFTANNSLTAVFGLEDLFSTRCPFYHHCTKKSLPSILFQAMMTAQSAPWPLISCLSDTNIRSRCTALRQKSRLTSRISLPAQPQKTPRNPLSSSAMIGQMLPF